jgi:hypothetical protein
MAEKIIRVLLDDMEGGDAEATGTVRFGLDGKSYEIDLSEKNQAKLRGCLQPFIDNARPAGGKATKQPVQRSGGPSGYGREQLAAIRDWARRNGWPELSDKGRVPAEVLAAFETQPTGNGQPQFSST